MFVLAFSSCSKKIAFTSDIQAKHQFSETTLKKVQFYTSKTIYLYKVSSDQQASVNGGKVLLNNNNRTERIIVKKNTPCIVEKVIDEKHFIVSFEYGVGKILAFGNNNGGCYSLMAKGWNEDMQGTLVYGGTTYQTNSGGVFLTIKLKKLTNAQNRERTLKGRKVK